jgi:hypothetical protein
MTTSPVPPLVSVKKADVAAPLSALQQKFALAIAALITYINSQGYTVTLSESYRSDVQAEVNALSHSSREQIAKAIMPYSAGFAHALLASTSVGIKSSVHRLRLAQDLNLFKDGVLQTTADAYKPFGTWWKAQNPEARWGGDFGDSDHFSFTYGGVE